MVFMNSRFLQIVFYSCIIFTSCKKTDKTLYAYIDSKTPNIELIDLKVALKVDYDTAFLFSECTNNKEIEMVLGIPYPQKTFLQDSEHKLILLKKHEIVYDNSFYYRRIEFLFYNQRYHFKKKHVEYTMWTESIFKVSLIEKMDGNTIYLLRPFADVVDFKYPTNF